MMLQFLLKYIYLKCLFSFKNSSKIVFILSLINKNFIHIKAQQYYCTFIIKPETLFTIIGQISFFIAC